jgi:hypothetical protein
MKGYTVYRPPRTQKQYKTKGEEYTVPRTRYKYKRVSWAEYMDKTPEHAFTRRSSFIPYTYINNEKYWLLGSFHDFPKDILMDFGGSCIIGKHDDYQHQFGCAVLELNEESKGLLVQPVLKSLGTEDPIIYKGVSRPRRKGSKDIYSWFVMVRLDYNDIKDIPDKFQRAEYILKGEELGPLGFYRESDILLGKHRSSRDLTDFVSYLKKQ